MRYRGRSVRAALNSSIQCHPLHEVDHQSVHSLIQVENLACKKVVERKDCNEIDLKVTRSLTSVVKFIVLILFTSIYL